MKVKLYKKSNAQWNVLFDSKKNSNESYVEEIKSFFSAVESSNKISISGEEVYGKLKFESGAHRVQRVPETESQGRIHTSACTVAVLPQV